MQIHNKLVRDKIPEYLLSKGISSTTKILNQAEYETELLNKLDEELHELKNAQTQEEAVLESADVIEVIRAIQIKHSEDMTPKIRFAYEQIEAVMNTYSIKWDEITLAREKKKVERGAFEQRILLLGTSE